MDFGEVDATGDQVELTELLVEGLHCLSGEDHDEVAVQAGRRPCKAETHLSDKSR